MDVEVEPILQVMHERDKSILGRNRRGKDLQGLAISTVFFYYVGRHLIPCRLVKNREVYGSRSHHFGLI